MIAPTYCARLPADARRYIANSARHCTPNALHAEHAASARRLHGGQPTGTLARVAAHRETVMRALLIIAVLSVGLPGVLPGCTPFIPMKDDFGTSALAPVGDIPPEFAEFNAYNPGVNPLLAYQLCATPYEP